MKSLTPVRVNRRGTIIFACMGRSLKQKDSGNGSNDQSEEADLQEMLNTAAFNKLLEVRVDSP